MTRSVFRILAIAVGLLAIGASYLVRRNAQAQLVIAEKQAIEKSAAAAHLTQLRQDVVSVVRVPSGTNFTELLRSSSIDSQTTAQITEAMQSVFKPRNLRAGQKLIFTRGYDGVLKSIRYRTSWDSELLITRSANGYTATDKKLASNTDVTVVEGTIHSSLFESVLATGETPELAVRLAEIFAWDLDFYTDPQPGDRFRLVFEKRTVPGEDNPSYGRIFAAEYVNGRRPFDAVLFHHPSGQLAYYTADGKSLQKAFLRSPLKFAARISSHFSQHRFHPVMKVYRAHLGTDYAAPVGTPVQAIANGRVEFAARKGGNGNLIILKHANGYETYYLHLSRLLVRAGQSVQQGQRIGLVGATGLASGPHLDFRMRRNGTFVNFEGLKLPPANPVARADQPAFFAERDKWIAMLQQAPAAQQHMAAEASPKAPAAD